MSRTIEEKYPDGKINHVQSKTGTLARAIFLHCQKHGVTPSKLVQLALAEYLGKPEPVMIGRLMNLPNLKKLGKRKLTDLVRTKSATKKKTKKATKAVKKKKEQNDATSHD